MSVQSPRHILVASDQPLEAQSIEGVLRGADYPDVRVTSDGREIIKLYAKWPFTLLILDLNISSHSAFMVLDELAEAMNSQSLGVLALTNEDDVARREQALAAGVLDVFTRPFTQAETLARVAGALAAMPDRPLERSGLVVAHF